MSVRKEALNSVVALDQISNPKNTNMLNRIRRHAFGAALALVSSGAFAATVTLSEGTWTNYSITDTFRSSNSVTSLINPCETCGNPGRGLDLVYIVPGSADARAAVGVIANALTYNPTTQGAISTIDASIDKNFLVSYANTVGIFANPLTNTFRPLIAQDGVYYLAAISGPGLLPNPPTPGPFSGQTGYNTISQAGLLATNFTRYDFSTGTFVTGNPNFAGSTITFGFSSTPLSSAGPIDTTFTSRHDNLTFVVNSGTNGVPPVTAVPEPETYALMLSGLGLLGFISRRRKKEIA